MASEAISILKRFEMYIKKLNKRPTTLIAYLHDIKQFFIYLCDHIDIQELQDETNKIAAMVRTHKYSRTIYKANGKIDTFKETKRKNIIKLMKEYVNQPTPFISKDLSKACIDEAFVQTKLCKSFTSPMITSYIEEEMIKVKGKNPNSINRALASIHLFLNFIFEKKIRNKKDFPQKFLPKKKKQVELGFKWLNSIQQRLLENITTRTLSPRNNAIIYLLYHTGIRVSELVNLTWKNIILSPRKEDSFIKIYYSKNQVSRKIPLNSEIKYRLKIYLLSLDKNCQEIETIIEKDKKKKIHKKTKNHFKKEKEEAVQRIYQSKKNANEYVFLSQKKKKLTIRGIEYIFQKHFHAYGPLKNVTPHTLRHTFARNLRDKKQPIENICRLLGHSNLNTTLRYLNPDNKSLNASVQTVSRLADGDSGLEADS